MLRQTSSAQQIVGPVSHAGDPGTLTLAVGVFKGNGSPILCVESPGVRLCPREMHRLTRAASVYASPPVSARVQSRIAIAAPILTLQTRREPPLPDSHQTRTAAQPLLRVSNR